MVIENFIPGTMARWGLDFDTVLAATLPAADLLRDLRFRRRRASGGLPGYDAVLQAMCGLMSVNGDLAIRSHSRRRADRRPSDRLFRAYRHPARPVRP